MPQTNTHEPQIIAILCCAAALHVLIFSAAFPFFNNVDEPIHFDLILRYSTGAMPHRQQKVLPETVEYIAYFNSPAYYAAPKELPGGRLPPPPWTESPEKKRQDFEANCLQWQSLENYEVSQSPLYYAITGLWWDFGKWLGLHGGQRLYFLRFLNVIPAVALVWLAYVSARMLFPEKPFVRLTVPALTAFMPQSAFYSLGNDILPALCFGESFLCLIRWPSAENPSVKTSIATGLTLAMTYLAKSTSLPLLVAAAAFVVVKLGQFAWQKKSAVFLQSLLAFTACTTLPVAAWMVWCKSQFGDTTGAGLKMEHFGWTIKPFAEWWNHPIFTPAGCWTYLSGQLSTFWQGEIQWHHEPLVLPESKFIYAAVSLGLIFASSLALFTKSSTLTPMQRRALALGLFLFISGTLFFAFMSIIYDFHDCPYPSREYPYFTSGRLLLGALVPFLIFISYGLDRVLDGCATKKKLVILAISILIILATEIITDHQVFSDPYNWFHLPANST